VGGITVPGGDPAALEQLAAKLEAAAQGAGDIGASTRQVTASVRSDADWTGDAADSYSDFTSNLSQGASAAEAPLSQIASAVRNYAGTLRTAQQEVQAYSSLAQAAQNDSTGSLISAAELAGQNASAAVTALQQAASQAAAQVSSAAGALENLAGTQGPVQTWINSQPGFGMTSIDEPGLGGTIIDPIPEDLGSGTEIYPLPPELGGGTEIYPLPPELGGGTEIYPLPPDLGGGTIKDPVPPDLPGLYINADTNNPQGGQTPQQQVGQILNPGGQPVGSPGNSPGVRLVPNEDELNGLWNQIQSQLGPGQSVGPGGQIQRIDLGGGDYVQYRPFSKSGGATIDVGIQGQGVKRIHIANP
jgi:uncharacterized protein YukE